MTSDAGDEFTPEQLIYHKYLKRRFEAGEAGSRMRMGDEVVAHAKLIELMGGEDGLVAATAQNDPTPVSDEIQALCDLLYITVAQEQGVEDASGE